MSIITKKTFQVEMDQKELNTIVLLLGNMNQHLIKKLAKERELKPSQILNMRDSSTFCDKLEAHVNYN